MTLLEWILPRPPLEDKFIYSEDQLILMAGGTTNDVIFKKLEKMEARLKALDEFVELVFDNVFDIGNFLGVEGFETPEPV